MDVRVNAWVPDNVSDLCVSLDGTVFTSGYAESGGGGASYKNGKLLGRYSGFNSGFGDPTSVVTVDRGNVYWGDGNGVQVYGFGGGTAPNASFLKGYNVLGLAVSRGQLFVSDYTNNLIRVYDVKTQNQVSEWKMLRPGKLVADRSGRLWVIQYGPDSDPGNGVLHGVQILSFSSSGTTGPVISDVTNPLAIAVDNANRLLVGGLDPSSQIRVYGNLNATPILENKIGVDGGILAAKPGKVGPLRFHFIKGLGTDSSGNIYVACCYGGVVWGQSVEVYSPSYKKLWQVFGNDYCDAAAIDPFNETEAYDIYHHYSLDFSKPEGRNWSLTGYTLNRFKYPGDQRPLILNGPVFRQTFGAVRIHGRLFLLCSTQNGYRLEMYRFTPKIDGEVAAPSVVINGGSENYISRDANGDGIYQASETLPGFASYQCTYDVTDDGDVLTIGDGNGDPKIIDYPLQGLDAVGNPIYSAATAISRPAPPDTGNLSRIVYDKAKDTLFIASLPRGDNDSDFTDVYRYDHWSGSPARSWRVPLPNNDKNYTPYVNYGGGSPLVLRAAGKYLFIAYGCGYVRVLNKVDGRYIGTIKPNAGGFSGGSGQIDGSFAMTATQLRNGDYIILEEDAGHNHIAMAHWQP